MRPPDLPPPSRWATRPHGTRLRYIAGCRCMLCRAANSRYETGRLRARAKGLGNGLVDAAPARVHIRALGRAGMGYKTVARAAHVGATTVSEVRMGRQTQMRAQARARILAVRSQLAAGALVPAGPTWRRLDRLIAEGFPKVRIARLLGLRGTGLQFKRTTLTVRNAERVQKLYRFLMAESRAA